MHLPAFCKSPGHALTAIAKDLLKKAITVFLLLPVFLPAAANIYAQDITLSLKDKSKNPHPSVEKPKTVWEKGFIKKLTGQPIDVLTNYLNWEMDALHVLDETHFTSPVDIELDVSINEETGIFDIARIKKSLNRYGFDLVRAARPVDILVIRDKKKPGNS